jgi:excisionase family DNA binding protein
MALLKASEVAKILRVSTARVYELARRGLLPTVILGERQVRFDQEVLRQWINKGGCMESKELIGGQA